jgi:tRNA(fMet)-specific endonuclease VapC
MMIKYLIDTDWAIYYLRGREDIVRRLNELKRDGLGLSVVSLAELYEGVFHSKDTKNNQRGLDDFLKVVSVIELTNEMAKIFGQERGRLRVTGEIIGDMDLLIAATALRYDAILLTNNRRHFERVENLHIQSLL